MHRKIYMQLMTMNKIKKFLKLKFKIFLIILPIMFLLVSCDVNSQSYVKIAQDSPIEISIGSSFQLEYECSSDLKEEEAIWQSNNECIQIDSSGLILAKEIGTAVVTLKVDNYYDRIDVYIIDTSIPQKIELRASKYYLSSGENATLIVTKYPETAIGEVTYEITKGKYYIFLSETNQITAGSGGGTATIVAKCGDIVSNEIEIITVKGSGNPTSITLTPDKQICGIGDYVSLDYAVSPSSASKNIEFLFNFGEENAYIIGNKIYITNDEPICVVGKIGSVYSNEILINATSIGEDPYKDITQREFYSNYYPANSYIDAYYRSLHGLMSGSIEAQKQEPTLSQYMPKENGLFLRNSSANYSTDGNTYYVIDSYGNIVNEIYKGGGYVILEEVAAYIFAFGEVPANYTERKTADPKTSIWGKYLRLNNTYFSGNTTQYPYEPVLPNIRGCGGELYYYEVDIGTTGTNCDPKYPPANYNNGFSISRGAARIVYTRFDANGDNIIDINEKYLFYTYNHYNDFQEYLNYQGGWGEMFGNITGGGEISSSINYNPTSYVQVIFKDFTDNSLYHISIENVYVLPASIKRKEFLFDFC